MAGDGGWQKLEGRKKERKKEEGRKTERQMYSGMFFECLGRRSIRRCKGAVIEPVGENRARYMTSGPVPPRDMLHRTSPRDLLAATSNDSI